MNNINHDASHFLHMPVSDSLLWTVTSSTAITSEPNFLITLLQAHPAPCINRRTAQSVRAHLPLTPCSIPAVFQGATPEKNYTRLSTQ